MKEEYVTVREFLRNFRKFSGKKKPIIISKNGKPQNVFIPYEQWEKEYKTVSQDQDMGECNLADMIEKYAFDGGDPDLSERVDEIVYGASNPYRNDNS